MEINPGSFEQYKTQYESNNDKDIVAMYGKALDLYREELAKKQGISINELHSLATNKMNETAL
ncbi:MAG: hypothetical protein NVSMB46_08550 [Candidatus Saccharimonadales bacterium]